MPNKIVYYTDKIDRLLKGKFVPPVTVEIDPSDNCPLSCNFCLFGRSHTKNNGGNNLKWTTFQKAIVQLKNMGCSSVTFTGGGEPLMHPVFANMVKLASGIGMKVGLVTNGVLLNKLPKEILRTFTFIRISLNAATPATYKIITGKDFFNKVLQNTINAINVGAFVGWSYVVSEQNYFEIEQAKLLAQEVDVKYIQFKPALLKNGGYFKGYNIHGKKVIDMKRFTAKNNLPCIIAHLVAIVAANGKMYYCCQYRDNKDFCVGDLNKEDVEDVWRRRLFMGADVSKCPQCRYMNYAIGYEQIVAERDIFFDHKEFL